MVSRHLIKIENIQKVSNNSGTMPVRRYWVARPFAWLSAPLGAGNRRTLLERIRCACTHIVFAHKHMNTSSSQCEILSENKLR